MKKIVCYGETVVDFYNKNKFYVAGAPLHVAAILSKLGHEAYIHSKIGNDTFGRKIINKAKKYNINTSLTKIDKDKLTGRSLVIKKKNSNFFDIDPNSAWDNILNIPNFKPNALYVGSVISRNSVSRNTFFKILKKKINIVFFDLNIRKPFFNQSYLEKMLKNFSTHIKMTKQELNFIKIIFNTEQIINYLYATNKNLKMICVTNGMKGSSIYSKNGEKNVITKVDQIKSSNTVGAGDAFSAGIIHGLVSNKSVNHTHIYASKLSQQSVKYDDIFNLKI